jgi:L-lysine exporter family protein LysE/ArgO
MHDILSLAATAGSAFVVTFLTVMVPNPSTVAASRYAMRDGTRSGAAFLSAVLFLDAVVFLVLAHGFHPALNALGVARYLMPVAGAGLVVFGGIMVVTARTGGVYRRSMMEARDSEPADTGQRPFVAGLVVPAANPGFWIWWTTVGTSFIHRARDWGGLGLGVLFIAFLSGAGAWYVALLWAVSHGRQIFSVRVQTRVLVVLGVAMGGFGVVLLWRSILALG